MSPPIVIVGGGTAGSTVALQLSTRTSREIVLCEPGDVSSWDDESRFFDVLRDNSLVHRESVSVLGRAVEYLQAWAVGGGSAINGLLLTGAEPPYVEGLTSIPDVQDIGDISRALLACGGRMSRLWWNRGRWNPGRALLHLVEEGRIDWKKSVVSRIEFDNGQVVGVEVGGAIVRTDCVVLAAGAIASPRLLLMSGLVSHGVGTALQDHPSISFVLERKTSERGLFDACVVRDINDSRGALGLMVAYERLNAENESMALVSVMLMNPDSRGEISLVNETLNVDVGLLSTQRDKDAMRELVRESVQILSSVEFQNVAVMIRGGASGASLTELSSLADDELDDWVTREVLPVSHVSSSLSACVDALGQFRGIHGLVVADSSVLPHVPHETPAATVTMEARRIGQLLGERLA